MPAPVLAAGTYQAINGGDGFSYTKPSRWAGVNPFNVDISGADGSPQYQVADPEGAWSTWDSVARSVAGNVVSDAILIPPYPNATGTAPVQSSPVAISEQGHQLRLRMVPDPDPGDARAATWSVGGQMDDWEVQTAAAPAGYPWDPLPITATTQEIAPGTTVLDGLISVPPGTTLLIQGGARGTLQLLNLVGTAENPIIITNKPGDARSVFTTTSNTTPLHLKGCRHVKVEGLQKYTGAAPTTLTRGIKLTKSGNVNPSFAIFISDNTPAGIISSDIWIRGIEMDGGWNGSIPITGGSINIGIRMSSDSSDRADFPGVFRENCLFEYNQIHNLAATMLYLGQNLGVTLNPAKALVDPIPCKNMTCRYNECFNTFGEGCDFKSIEAGYLRVHDNLIYDTGLGQTDDRGEGIQCYECTNCDIDIYNNILAHCSQYGIGVKPQHQIDRGNVNVNIYNNIVYDSGYAIPAGAGFGHGINVGTSNPSGGASVHYGTVRVYNNTVHKTKNDGISVDNGACDVEQIYNNIVSRASTSGNGSAYPSWLAGSGLGNITLTAGQGFIDEASAGTPWFNTMDLGLLVGSAAVSAGISTISGNLVPVPTHDQEGVARGSPVDSGALEYVA